MHPKCTPKVVAHFKIFKLRHEIGAVLRQKTAPIAFGALDKDGPQVCVNTAVPSSATLLLLPSTMPQEQSKCAQPVDKIQNQNSQSLLFFHVFAKSRKSIIDLLQEHGDVVQEESFSCSRKEAFMALRTTKDPQLITPALSRRVEVEQVEFLSNVKSLVRSDPAEIFHDDHLRKRHLPKRDVALHVTLGNETKSNYISPKKLIQIFSQFGRVDVNSWVQENRTSAWVFMKRDVEALIAAHQLDETNIFNGQNTLFVSVYRPAPQNLILNCFLTRTVHVTAKDNVASSSLGSTMTTTERWLRSPRVKPDQDFSASSRVKISEINSAFSDEELVEGDEEGELVKRCAFCREYGHSRATCKLADVILKRCFFCKESDHFMKKCTTLYQYKLKREQFVDLDNPKRFKHM